jgi:hypothetical protein
MTESHFRRSRYTELISWENYQHLEQRVMESQKLPYKLTVSDYFRESRGANLLTSMILFYLKMDEVFCYRNITQGISRKVGDRIKFIPNKGMRGSGDIYSLIGGMTVWIEVKFKRDRQSDYQRQFQKEIERSGGQYWLIRTFDQFLETYNNMKIDFFEAYRSSISGQVDQ